MFRLLLALSLSPPSRFVAVSVDCKPSPPAKVEDLDSLASLLQLKMPLSDSAEL